MEEREQREAVQPVWYMPQGLCQMGTLAETEPITMVLLDVGWGGFVSIRGTMTSCSTKRSRKSIFKWNTTSRSKMNEASSPVYWLRGDRLSERAGSYAPHSITLRVLLVRDP